ncbi:MAG: condensation domain-containing protein, partial [Pseudonocardiaceae bacterium]
MKRLVAYVVAGPGLVAPGAGVLREFLHRVLPDYMVPSAFVVLDGLPLSPNGKLDRQALPAPDLTAAVVGYVAPRTDTERVLAGIWADVLGVERVGVEDNFFELGGDSILSIQVVSRARRVGLGLTARDVFLRQTVAGLVVGVGVGSGLVDRGVVVGPALLTPIQSWFFESAAGGVDHLTMSMVVELVGGVDEGALGVALDGVVAHHEALRTRFECVGERVGDGIAGGWRQVVVCGESVGVLQRCDLSGLDGEGQRVAMEQAALACQAGMDVVGGGLVRAVLFVLGSGCAPRLFVAVHHLVMDGVSWRVLFEDLERAYWQVCAGDPVELEPVGTSLRQWAHRLAEHVRGGGLDEDLAYWVGVSETAVATVPVDRAGVNTVGSGSAVSVRLGRADTDALLHQVPGVYRTQVNDVLLAALGVVLGQWVGQPRVVVALEGHGREEFLDRVDLSRTVGWFTTLFPVVLGVSRASGWGQVLRSVKEQLRAVPHRGVSYGALRYLSAPDSPAGVLGGDPLPQVSFNYHGQWDAAAGSAGLYRRWCAGIGQDADPTSVRHHVLDVIGVVADGELELSWVYSRQVHDESTVSRLAHDVIQALREIIEHCAAPGAGGRSPSDFPLAGLDQSMVDQLVGDGRGIEDVYPLTPLQTGMVFHSLVDSSSGAYLDQMCLRLSGVSDPQALGLAWQRVVDRTAVLRSRVVWDGVQTPLQVVCRQVTVPTTYHDWRGLSAAAADQQQRQLLAADRAAGMDLTTVPLLRVTIARLPHEQALLVWTSHHVLLDGWSLAQVLGEVSEHYAAIVEARPARLVTRRPFRDYLHWLSTQDQAQAQQYWRAVLAGVQSPTPLAYDRAPIEAHRAESSQSVSMELPTEQSARLQQLAQHNGLTVNTIVVGAWALLLSRYSAQRDVVFGTTVSGRPAELAGVEDMVGMFINTIPTRVTIPDQHTTLSWLQHLQTTQVEARRFDFVSLTHLHTLTDLPPTTPLFDSIVVFENYPIDQAAIADNGLQIHELHAVDTTSYPLTLAAHHNKRLSLDLAYDPDLFDPATITHITQRLQLLLTRIIENPHQPVSQLSILSETERDLVLHTWNDTGLDVPVVVFSEVLQAQVALTPEVPALVFGDSVVGFAEL